MSRYGNTAYIDNDGPSVRFTDDQLAQKSRDLLEAAMEREFESFLFWADAGQFSVISERIAYLKSRADMNAHEALERDCEGA